MRQCIDSVLRQTYRDMEIILVDDGSPDSCPKICDEYVAKDSRVIVVHKENGGAGSARNSGVDRATGDYGIFLDGDDYWRMTDGLERLVLRVCKTDCDVLSFPYYKVNEKLHESDKPYCFEDDMSEVLRSKAEQLDFLTSRSLYISSSINKLIRISLLRMLPFRDCRLSEDAE